MGKRLGRFALEFVCGYALAFGVGMLMREFGRIGCFRDALLITMLYAAPVGAIAGVAIGGWLTEKPRRLNPFGLVFGWLLALSGFYHTLVFGHAAKISVAITELIVPGITKTDWIVDGLVAFAPIMVLMAYVGWQAGRLIGKNRQVKENPVS